MTSEQRQRVSNLLNLEEGLTDWEIGFLDNLMEKYWETSLTKKQDRRLKDICTEKEP